MLVWKTQSTNKNILGSYQICLVKEDEETHNKLFSLYFLCRLFLSYVHHHFIQRLAFKIRHGGISCRVTYGKQQQQLLIGRPFEEQPEPGAAVEGSRCDGNETHILMSKWTETKCSQLLGRSFLHALVNWQRQQMEVWFNPLPAVLPAGFHRIWRHWFHCSSVSFSCRSAESRRSVWRWGSGVVPHPNTPLPSSSCRRKDDDVWN